MTSQEALAELKTLRLRVHENTCALELTGSKRGLRNLHKAIDADEAKIARLKSQFGIGLCSFCHQWLLVNEDSICKECWNESAENPIP